MGCIVLAVLHEGVRIWKIAFAVILEKQIFTIRNERIPIPTEIRFRVICACINFVDRYQLAVARVVSEEGARAILPLQDSVIALVLLHKITELQAGRAGANDQKIVSFFHLQVSYLQCLRCCYPGSAEKKIILPGILARGSNL